MKLRLNIIEDAFNVGGYLDTHTLNYIAPKWLHDTNPKYHQGLTDAQFKTIQTSSTRYLKLPLIRPAALRCVIALQMGISEERLAEAGIPKQLYREVIWSDAQDIDTASPNYSDTELNLLCDISCILMINEKMDECFRLEYQFFADTMLKYLAEHNIKLEITPKERFP